MNETLISPGVLAIENDQSLISQLPIQADATAKQLWRQYAWACER